KGKHHTEETKQRIRAYIHTEEAKRKIKKNNVKYWQGRKRSEETKEKLRISRLRYKSKFHNNGEPIIPCIGQYEKPILDVLEYNLGFTILRQYPTNGFFLDGYCPALNLAIEIDEPHHQNPYYYNKDLYRQETIKNNIHCSFLRIPIPERIR
ncbi:unnamed protein product, partial [marine sediment metagenome]